jgi:phage terminase large subunit-like protein
MARRREAKVPDRITQYALDVVEGRIVAGRLVHLACERHLRDLETGGTRGLRWDPEAADHAIGFFRFLRHSKGEWAGSVVQLEPWQQFRIGSVFGWQRKDEETGEWVRRFRTAYNEVARKNGKSTESAGVGLYLLDADGEPGAEVYSAATKRDQAKIVWEEASRMVRKSPALKKLIRIFPGKGNMCVEETASKFEPLGADDDYLDGLNIHGAVVDELHAHKTRGVWDVIETATGSRRQPLIWAITTAGFDQNGICFELRTYSIDVLEGRIEDDSWFAYIATLDEGDDPFDEAVWPKANPNLGVSKKWGDMRRLAKKARAMPTALNNFLTKHLNVWTQQAKRWIPLDLWDKNAGDTEWMLLEETLKGRCFFGGLDLSSVLDITAWVMGFPRDDDPETVDFLCRFWVPEARLYADDNRYRDQYQAWVRTGALKTTPGDAVDYDFVVAQILKDAETFQLQNLNIDRLFQGHQVAVRLMDELGEDKVVGMGQGFVSMAAPAKEFERRLMRKKLHHGGQPVLRWMAGNVSTKTDPAGNIKPDKSTSQGKIDGIVGEIMALDRVMRHQGPTKSVYEERGILRA